MASLAECFVFVAAAALSAQAAPPAFPTAQGFGAMSAGGRGGAVMHVTNLNDSGAGSLRACVEASGPRICVFDTGGTIVLASQLKIANPYITIAGQTAPGGGITIDGMNVLSVDPFRPATHDILVQYIRIGTGYNSKRTSQTGDAIAIYGDTYNAIFDHVSLRWGQDETFQLWNNAGSIHNVTLSNSILADPNSAHSCFLISGGQNSSLSSQVYNNDWHHNVIVTGSHRIPLDKAGDTEFVNNIVYNYGFYCSQILGGGRHDYIGNVYKQGPYSLSNGYSNIHEIQAASSSGLDALDGSPSIYASGNVGWHLADPSGDQTRMMATVTGENGSETGPIDTHWLAGSRQLTQTYPIAPDAATSLDTTLLPHAGASRHLNCDGTWSSMRDSLDAGWISDYQNATGPGPDQNSTFPTVAAGTRCTDTDGDGMPDAWETAHGLDPNNPADANQDPDLDGYTNIEEYLNGTDPHVADGPQVTPPPPADTTPPVVSNGLPTGTLPAGTKSATLSVTTDEAATCRYSTSPGTAYAAMKRAFSVTGGTQHSTAVSVRKGTSYNFYVRCQDAAGNADTTDYPISFAVAR